MRPDFSIREFCEDLHKNGHIYTCNMKPHDFWKINNALVKSVTMLLSTHLQYHSFESRQSEILSDFSRIQKNAILLVPSEHQNKVFLAFLSGIPILQPNPKFWQLQWSVLH
jgi:hypothetical protein